MSDTASTGPPSGATRPAFLHLAVIVAVGPGTAVGILAPGFATSLKPLGEAFIAMVRMMISPIIFCTIALGIGSIRQAAKVGRVGGLALGYFLAMSTVALAIGLVVGNILKPGSGLDLDLGAVKPYDAPPAAGTTDFLLDIIPTRSSASRCRPATRSTSTAPRPIRRWRRCSSPAR